MKIYPAAVFFVLSASSMMLLAQESEQRPRLWPPSNTKDAPRPVERPQQPAEIESPPEIKANSNSLENRRALSDYILVNTLTAVDRAYVVRHPEFSAAGRVSIVAGGTVANLGRSAGIAALGYYATTELQKRRPFKSKVGRVVAMAPMFAATAGNIFLNPRGVSVLPLVGLFRKK